MAKGFPYFKFIATEWLTGDIVFEDLDIQGLFINICAIYWQRNGQLSIDDIEKRYANKTDRLSKLADRFFTVSNNIISIKFLDEQLIDAGHISKINSQNGAKGGRPKSSSILKKKPTAKRNKATESKGETEIEEEIKVEINKSELEKKFDEFLKFRIALKKPVKEESLEALKKSLWKLSNQNEQIAIEIIEQSIANGYQGLFELKKQNQNGKFISKADERARGFADLDAEIDRVLTGVKLQID